MKIARLLELDKNYWQKATLNKSFGDSYLYEKNRIYKSVRSAAISFGFNYTDHVSNSFNILPLSQLENILAAKLMPFFDNVSVLTEIEQKIPSKCNWDDVVDNLKKNYVFHESCHAVARYYSTEELKNLKDQEDLVLKILLEESFANACELLATQYVEDSAHRIFYEANSYFVDFELRQMLNELTKELGFDFVFYYVLLNYLYANFLQDKNIDTSSEKTLVFIKNNLNLSVENDKFKLFRKKLNGLSRKCMELNPRFRFVTTRFYFQLHQINKTAMDLEKTNFLTQLGRSENFILLIRKLAEVLR